MWTIKWSYIRLSNPECGFIYKTESPDDFFWFSSPVGDTQTKEKENPEIKIFKLQEDLMDSLEKEHTEYCKASGAPLNHGDKYSFPKTNTIIEDGRKKVVPTIFRFNVAPHTITGELITILKKEDIVNYTQTKQL